MTHNFLSSLNKKTGIKAAFIIIASLVLSFVSKAQDDCYLEPTLNTYFNNNITGGSYGYYLKEVNGPIIANNNGFTTFEPASAIKVLFHAHAMRRVQLGISSLNSLVFWERDLNDDRPGARPRSSTCTPSNPDWELDQLSTVLQGMMEQSDNRHTQAIRDLYGDGNILNTANALGLTNTDLNHNIGCFCNNLNSNNTTLRDLARIYEEVATGYLSGGSRDTFYQLMLQETNNMGTLVDNLVDQLNIGLGIDASDIADFKSRIRIAYKGGSYGCGANLWRSNAGWIRLPFKTSYYSITNKEYVFGVYANQVSAVNVNSRTLSLQVLRDQIEAALQTWKSEGSNIALLGNITSSTVGEYINSELPILTDVLSICRLTSSRVATSSRTTTGLMKSTVWDITNNGNTITAKDNYYAGGNHMMIDNKRLTSSRFITAAIRNGNLQLRVWDVDGTGDITLAGTGNAGTTNEVSLVRLSSTRVVTCLVDSDQNQRNIVWDINGSGSLTRRGTYVLDDASNLIGTRLSSSRFATACRDLNTGTLKVYSWSISGSATPVLIGFKTAGAIGKIAINNSSSSQFITHLQQGNLLHKSILWEVCPSGTIRRMSDRTSSNIYDINSTRHSNLLSITGNKNYSSGFLTLRTYEHYNQGQLVYTGYKTVEKIGQVDLDYLSGTRFVTAYTNASRQLELSVWSLNGLPISLKSSENMFAPEVAQTSSYPNPATGITNIEFNCTGTGNVSIELTNTGTMQSKTIFNDVCHEGAQSISFDAGEFESGTYIYQIKMEDQILTDRLVIIQ